ncbi:MAG: hypothetical protein ACHP7A_05970 [Caulobacterales bacterium]|jgi:hypothetical protein
MSQSSARPVSHPAPHRHRVSIAAQLAGIAAGPVVWALQFEIGYALTAYACFPGDTALSAFAPGWGWTRPAAIAVNLAAVAICLAAGWLSFRAWRRTREEAPGPPHHVVEIAEGRTRFLAVCGAFTSFGFALAVAFDTVMILGAPACRA